MFLVPRPITAWDRHRWGFDVLAANGIAPRALDLSRVLGGRAADGSPTGEADRPATLDAFAREVEAARTSSVFIDYLRGVSGPDSATAPLFRSLRDAGALYYVVAGGSLPLAPATRGRVRRAIAHPGRALRHVRSLVGRRVAERFGGYVPPWKVFGPPAPAVTAFAARYRIPPDRLIATNSLDFDALARGGAQTVSIFPPCCVFVDDGLAGHPDLEAPGRRAVDAEPYFAALRRVFDRIEGLTGRPVVVAAHLRSDAIRPDLVGGRRVVRGATAEAIAASTLVLGHASTALGFAVLARKPLILLGGRYVVQAGLAGAVAALAEALGAPVIDPDDADALAALGLDVAVVRDDRYDRYLDLHVRARNAAAGSLWEVVGRHATADVSRRRPT